MANQNSTLFEPLTLPCGAILKNRIAKSAMSDSLGDGAGTPTAEQANLYRVWAEGGVGLAIIGEVQGDPTAAEKPGNLVVGPASDPAPFRTLTQAGSTDNAHIWAQLGHAGAMAFPPIGVPVGPSALDLPDLTCAALSESDIAERPAFFARTAASAKALGFGGVQIHAAHGFLLSQFLSPLFNLRKDAYGGTIENRARLTFETLDAVRAAVGPDYPVAIKLNATDQLEGGLSEADALWVVEQLDKTSIDLIDVSGGTYFPGAPSASDRAGKGPYFLEFAKTARRVTDKPLMLTGGFKDVPQMLEAREAGVDVIGLARALALDPNLPNALREGGEGFPAFPRFSTQPPGGVTAWFTMQLTALAEGKPLPASYDLEQALSEYEARDVAKVAIWNKAFPVA